MKKISTMETSSFGKLNWKDALKAVILTFVTSALTVVLQGLQNGLVDLKQALIVGLTAAIAYVLKNLLEGDVSTVKK